MSEQNQGKTEKGEGSTGDADDVRTAGAIENPSLYERLSKPFTSFEEANARFEDFFEGVRELRTRYEIRDVAIVVCDRVVRDDGELQDVITCASNGDASKVRMLHAWALGCAEADETRRIDDVRKQAKATRVVQS